MNCSALPSPLRALLLDLDGTLVVSDLDFALMRREMGLTDSGIGILEWLDQVDPCTRDRGWKILERHERSAAEGSCLMAGARDLLFLARELELKTCIITRNSDEVCRAVMARHDIQVDYVIAREHAPPKPSPEPVWMACEQLGVRPAESLVVGDFRYDILSGKEAGAFTAYLRRGREDPDAVLADVVLDGLGELCDLLRERLA